MFVFVLFIDDYLLKGVCLLYDIVKFWVEVLGKN